MAVRKTLPGTVSVHGKARQTPKNKSTIFAYIAKKGPLHRIPAPIKLLLMILFSLICMSLPIPVLAALIVLTAFIAFACGISPDRQFSDLKPALFYGTLMYILSIFSQLFEIRFPVHIDESLINNPALKGRGMLLLPWNCIRGLIPLLSALKGWVLNPSARIKIISPKISFVFLILRFALILQLSALLFRSTTTLEIRDSLNEIETRIRRFLSRLPFLKKHIELKPRLGTGIALFAGFIPEIFQTWERIDRAWLARGGKNNSEKIRTLVFILISLSFEKAAQKAKAIAARGG